VQRPWRIGIDTGGTFTDGILWNEAENRIATAKVLSTPDDPSRAVFTAVQRLLTSEYGAEPAEVSYLVHGTTVATNAVLEHRLSSTAFVTTRGFRDILEIARQVRENAFDVFGEKPPTLVPRHLCFEVDERLDASGRIIRSLDIASVRAVADDLAKADVSAVAVCLLHAYRNPEHERKVGEILREQLPHAAISLSSDMSSEFREFQRACTTIINASLVPRVGTYLRRLDEGLGEAGLSGGRLVMQSNGGISEFAESAEKPVFLIESGPAAGVVSAAYFGALLNESDVISFDMGGTTAKVGLVQAGKPHRVQEFEIGLSANRARSWNAGAAGYPILTPAIDLIEIGTGGGSIAWIDDGGKLRVGPRSAGAQPGPACYGAGGTAATITDADLILGRINPANFLGGEMPLDIEAARAAVGILAQKLRMDVVETAAGIVQIADAAMAQALRVVSVQRGYDPANFKLVPFGGAGPLHALAVAEQNGITKLIVPPRPGVASAVGLLVADLKHDFATTLASRLEHTETGSLESTFRSLERQGRGPLLREGVDDRDMRFERALDLRYLGQSYHLTVSLNSEPISREMLEAARRKFDEGHLAAYGYSEPSEPCELVNARVSATGAIRQNALRFGVSASHAPAASQPRRVWFERLGFVECSVHQRASLTEGAAMDGPAVIEDRDATTLIHPGWRLCVVSDGALLIERRQ
jgi:N-methylhydantoinase A